MTVPTGEPAQQGPLLSIPLRDGGALDLWLWQIAAPGETAPLADIVQAQRVAVPASAASPETEGLLLRLRDGRAPLYVPALRYDIARFLDALYTRRPDLRPAPPRAAPAPPPAGASGAGASGAGASGAGASGAGASGAGASGASQRAGTPNPPRGAAPAAPPYIASSDRLFAALAHLSVFFAPLLAPLALWLALRGESPYAARQAKGAFYFHLGTLALVALFVAPTWVVAIVTGVVLSGGKHSPFGALSLVGFTCGLGVMLLIALASAGLAIWGSVRSFQGQPFHYTFLARI